MRPLAFAVLVLALTSCRAPEPAPSDRTRGPWERRDLWLDRPQVEASPFANRTARPDERGISFLGAAEVRDLSKVPPQQLAAFPRRTAGQVRALGQTAGSRLKWRLRVGRDAYVSFVPLGPAGDAGQACPCTYRMGVRSSDGTIHELSRLPVEAMTPAAPFAQAAVEVPLAAWEGQEVDLLFQIDGPPDLPSGQPLPAALWGSPAFYSRTVSDTTVIPVPGGGKPNVLVLGIDTLRADALGTWGRSPSLTPTLDRLAAESDIWLDAYSAFNVTNPSFVSIFTGLWGKNHGIYDLQTPLPATHTTLAELFSAAGYDTMAVISAHHLGAHNSGLGQGFAEVTTASEHFAAELAVDMTADWLAGRKERPFFAWVHLFDPHTPHTPPEPYAVGFRPAAAAGLAPVSLWEAFRPPGPRGFTEPVLGADKTLYNGEVAYLDRQVGRLLDWMASRGLLDNTVVALVADHGENLGDHGILYRHLGLWDSTTHVPLLVRRPGARSEGRQFKGLVQTIDLFPTLLRLANLPVPAQDGQDLYELTGEGRTGRRAVFAEHAGRLGLMARTERYQYILSSGNNPRFIPDGPALYDVAADPDQNVNLAGRGLPAEREMDALLKRWLATRRKAATTQQRALTLEEEQRLRALGYQ